MPKSEAIKKWVERNEEKFRDEDEKSHLIDFLNDKWSQKNSINFSYEQALEKADKWIEEIQESHKNLKKSGEVEVVTSFPDGFSVVKLLDQTSKDWESLHMGNCIARIHSGNPGIYSLRDKDQIPHVSIDIENGEVYEIKGKGDSKVAARYLNYVLKFLIDHNISFSKKSSYINLVKISSYNLNILKKDFKGVISFEVKGKHYFFTGNILKSKKEQKTRFEKVLEFTTKKLAYDIVGKHSQNASLTKRKFWKGSVKNLSLLFAQDEKVGLKVWRSQESEYGGPPEDREVIAWLLEHKKFESLKEIIKLQVKKPKSYSFYKFGEVIKSGNLEINKILLKSCVDNKNMRESVRSYLSSPQKSMNDIVFLYHINYETLEYAQSIFPEFNAKECLAKRNILKLDAKLLDMAIGFGLVPSLISSQLVSEEAVKNGVLEVLLKHNLIPTLEKKFFDTLIKACELSQPHLVSQLKEVGSKVVFDQEKEFASFCDSLAVETDPEKIKSLIMKRKKDLDLPKD